MFFKNNPVFIIVLYLTLIKIKLNMEQSFKKGVVLNLASLVEYSEGGVISQQLIKSPAGNVTF